MSKDPILKDSDWMTLKEVAAELRCSVAHIHSLLGHRGGPVQIAHFKHGKLVYVTRGELTRYKATVEVQGVMRDPQFRRA